MVQASSVNSKNIKATAVGKNNTNAVEASNSEAKYWAEQAKKYANDASQYEGTVNDLYEEIQTESSTALMEIQEAKEKAIEEIEQKGEIGNVPTKVSQLENDANYISSNDSLIVKKISQEDYNNLEEKDPNTLYVVLTNMLIWGTSLWGTGMWELNNGELSGD